MERLTYNKHRGYHYYSCQFCGKEHRERIPDKASPDYEHNSGNPIMGICPNCNHGVGAGGIRLFPYSLPASQKGIDSDREINLDLASRIPDLSGVWRKYAEIALKFERKVKQEDRQDIVGDIILKIAEIDKERTARGEALTEAGMIRVASYTVMQYWEARREITTGLDCQHCNKRQRVNCRDNDLYSQCPKLVKIVSLNQEIEDGQGNIVELWETIADDKAIDLNAWIDTNVLLESFPKRLIELVQKKVKGESLALPDRIYLCRFRKNSQISLFQ